MKKSKVKAKTNGQKAWATRKRNLKNQYTGKPRHWVCYNNGCFDDYLEAIEALYTGTDKLLGGGLDSKTADEIAERFEGIATHLRESSEAKSKAKGEVDLSPEEQRYCELEGIDPKEFLERKRSKV